MRIPDPMVFELDSSIMHIKQPVRGMEQKSRSLPTKLSELSPCLTFQETANLKQYIFTGASQFVTSSSIGNKVIIHDSLNLTSTCELDLQQSAIRRRQPFNFTISNAEITTRINGLRYFSDCLCY